MTAHHFFVDADAVDGGVLRLTGAEAHHAARSLRVRPGEAITAADGTGRMFHAVVRHVDDDVTAEITGVHTCEDRPPRISLLQALTKRESMDLVVEKASEVGVRRIVPFVADRSVVRWDAAKRTRAVQRWSAIARSAAKQSKSPWITEIASVADDVARAVRDDETTLVLHESADVRLRDALPQLPPPTIAVTVGPEGGFDEAETARLGERGSSLVSLGPRILRTETAGVIAAALVSYHYGNVG